MCTEVLYPATTLIVNGKFVLQLINVTEDDLLNFLAIVPFLTLTLPCSLFYLRVEIFLLLFCLYINTKTAKENKRFYYILRHCVLNHDKVYTSNFKIIGKLSIT